MKATITLFLSVAALLSSVAAQAPVYKFDESKIPVGNVYHYLKTNVDGSQPEYVSTFIASRDRIESFKYHEKGMRAGLVIAELDWTNFMARRLESWQVFSRRERRLFATLTFDAAARTAAITVPSGKDPEISKMGTFPVHLYNFDLASLNVTFPHLADPRQAFRVGIADPTFASGPSFEYKGELAITYERDEPHDGIETRRYRAAGDGIGGRGTIWVGKSDGHIVDMEFDVANNPEWKSFKLKLSKIEKMTSEQWRDFIASRF